MLVVAKKCQYVRQGRVPRQGLLILVCALAALFVGGAGPGQPSSNQDSLTGVVAPKTWPRLPLSFFVKVDLDKMTFEWYFKVE